MLSAKTLRNTIVVLITAGWINVSEFVRNEVILKKYWLAHFDQLQLAFPSNGINVVVWLLWGGCLSCLIFVLSQKFSFMQTVTVSWFSAFFMMWLVTWNLSVFPAAILLFALPLSLVEVGVAAAVVHKYTAIKN